MRTLFLLGIAMITFLLSNSLMISPYTQIKETPKARIKASDADWENLHLMIERSPVDSLKANFAWFIKHNSLETYVLNCNNGKYFGLTPADDYGYVHLVFLEINQGKIINISYDELKLNGMTSPEKPLQFLIGQI